MSKIPRFTTVMKIRLDAVKEYFKYAYEDLRTNPKLFAFATGTATAIKIFETVADDQNFSTAEKGFFCAFILTLNVN